MKKNVLRQIIVLGKWTFHGLFVQLLFTSILIAADGQAQSVKSVRENFIEIEFNNSSIFEAFKKIEQMTGYNFAYERGEVSKNIRLNKKYSSKIAVSEVLLDISQQTDLKFKQVNKNIIVTERGRTPMEQAIEIVVDGITIRGKITSSDNQEGMPGVNVLIKGTLLGTVSDVEGNYVLEVPDGKAVLSFSSVGYEKQEIIVGSQTSIDVALFPLVKSLDEVVVVAYGTQHKREVSGSITSVKGQNLEDQPVTTVLQKMQGQMAGVQVNQTSGTPGRGMNIRIRGAASVSAGNDPLYVVDGIPIVNGINNINPNEIDNISVLKGVAAASLYGSRAANGVVLITTKQAEKGQLKFDVNITSGIGVIPEYLKPNVMNAKEFLTHEKYIWEDNIRYQGVDPAAMPDIFKDPDSYTGPDTDWYDELLRSSGYTDYNITLSYGSDKFTTSNSIAYHKEKGTILNTDYKRISMRSNNVFKINKNLRTGFNIAPTFFTSNNASTDGGYQILFSAISTPPIFDPDELGPDGTRVGKFTAPPPVWGTNNNVKKILLENENVSQSIRLLSNAFIEVDFLKGFQFRSAVGVDYAAGHNRWYSPSTVGAEAWVNPPKIATAGSSNQIDGSWTLENSLRYNKTFNENHNVEALVSYAAQKYTMDNLSGSGDTFADDQIPYLSAATNSTSSAGTTSWSIASIISRLNYNYKGKYLLSASFRRDGSSRFGENNRWGSFPSISAAWIVSDESFAESLPFSFLKLRAEYGKTGNFNIGNYTHFGGIGEANYVVNGSIIPGRAQTTISNSELTWETTTGLGIGLDFGLFEDRLSFTFDYYKKTTDGLLYRIDIPISTGYNSINSNIGEFDFWGYEFSLTSRNLVGELKWNTNFNISFDRNKVIKLGTENNPIGGGGSYPSDAVANRTEVGHPIGQFWGWVFDGVYKNQDELDSQPKGNWNTVGSARFKDLNGDGEVTDTDDDKTFIGNPQPDFTFGMSNSLSYKNFDMSILISGSYGNDLIYGVLGWTETLEGLFNAEKHLLDRWRSPEDPGSGDVAGTATGNVHLFRRMSTRHVKDASHLSIKNITFGYTLPEFSGIIQNARIYASVQQLYVFSSYPGANPEASNLSGLRAGGDVANYPVPRTFALGVNLTF